MTTLANETYKKMKDRHQKEFDDFPICAAFSEKQLEEGMIELGVADRSQLLGIGAGCFIRRSDKVAFLEMVDRQDAEMKAAINADTTGLGFVYEMFLYELDNHEYCVTLDPEDAIEALGLTYDEVRNTPNLWNGFRKAEAVSGSREC